MTGEVAVIGMRHSFLIGKFRIVNIIILVVTLMERGSVYLFSVPVEPVFSRSARLAHPSKESGVAHGIIAERHTEEEDASPSLHGLRTRLLSIAIAVTHAAGKGVTGPGIKGAEEREPMVATVPVGIILGYEFEHLTIVVTEIIVDHSKQGTGKREIAIMEMVVIEGVAVIARVVAHKATPSVISRKEIRVLTRDIRQPVDQGILELVVAGTEERLVAHLTCKHHVKGHLSEAFTTPVGISTEASCRRIGLNHLQHAVFEERILHTLGIGGSCIPWQHAVEVVVHFKVITGSHLQHAMRSTVGNISKRKRCRGTIAIVMGQESLHHVFGLTARAQILGPDMPHGLHLSHAIV